MKLVIMAVLIFTSLSSYAQLQLVKFDVFCGKVKSTDEKNIELEEYSEAGNEMGLKLLPTPDRYIKLAQLVKGGSQKFCLSIPLVRGVEYQAWITTFDTFL